MKRLAAAAILLCQATNAQAPFAHWDFEAISDSIFVRDVSGNGYDLVAVSKKSTLQLVDGAVGKGLSFKEPGYHVFVAESDGKFNLVRGTIEAVVLYRPSPYPTTQLIFCNTTFMPGIAEGWDFNILTGGTLSFNTGNTSRPGGLPWNILKAPEYLVEGRAYHLAATWNDNGVNKLFINGKKVAFKEFVEYTPSKDLSRFGYHVGDVKIGSWLYSMVDEVVIHNRVLTELEMLERFGKLRAGIDSLNGGSVSADPDFRSQPGGAILNLEPAVGGFRLSVADMSLKSAVVLDLQGRTLLTLKPSSPQGGILIPAGFEYSGQVRIQAVSETGQSLGGNFHLRR